MGDSYIPSRDPDALIYLQNFSGVLSTSPGAYYASQADAQNLAAGDGTLADYTWPDPKADPAAYSTYRLLGGQSAYATFPAQTDQYVVFVHGWRMTPDDRDAYNAVTYKRLFWQGYSGRFAAFNWPTDWMEVERVTRVLTGLALDAEVAYFSDNFDRSEERAWHSAGALADLLRDLGADVGYQNVNVFAHSMGNVVVSEALRLAGPDKLVHGYVAAQAAVAAEAYDPLVTAVPANRLFPYSRSFPPGYWPAPQDDVRPQSEYANFNRSGRAYFADIHQAADVLVNFWNATDFATSGVWPYNQVLKPDVSVDYPGPADATYTWDDATLRYQRTVGGVVSTLDPAVLSDRYEMFSYAAEPRSLTLGTMQVGGPFNANVEVSQFTSGDQTDHSPQFLGTYADRRGWWAQLLNAFGISQGGGA